MTDEIVQLAGADFDEAMAVMNLAFDKSPPSDFEHLLPKLYRADDEAMACHYAIRRDGAIRAVVGLYPLTWKLGSRTLRIAGIGGVSTHPNCRGQGMMQRLMEHCVKVMKDEGYHLSWLGGQRQRYGFFGYEKCGLGLKFHLDKSNLKHRFSKPSSIHFEPLTDDQKDPISTARELHASQAIRADRSYADFHCVLRSWISKPFVAFENPASNRIIGYLVSDRNETLVEIAGLDGDTEFEMTRAWLEQSDRDAVTIDLGPNAGGCVRLLDSLCEHVSISHSANWLIFDWPAVIRALLEAKAMTIPLTHGEVTVGIEDIDTISIRVDGNGATCNRIDGEVALKCDAKLAHRLLFGPLQPSQVTVLPAEAAVLESWCPLPLFWPRLDAV